MFKTADEVLKFIKDEDVKFVDIRFTDLPGVQQHFNVPAKSVDLDFFVHGQLFDGSSIRGFQGIAESDMQLIPDVTSAFIDTFRIEKTLALNFSIVNPRTGDPYHRDPRGVAEKAEAYLASTGIADTAFFAPEAEFFVFDNIQYESSPQGSFYKIDSEEAHWNTGRKEEGGNLGYKTPVKGGYFPVSPTDKQADLRDAMCVELDKAGLEVASRNLKKLSDAGVRIAMGTDTGPPARFQGYFELMELELMAKAGMTPQKVLAAATRDAAHCMKLDREIGTIEANKWADFVVLDADPLANISNVKKINSVYVAGNRVAE